MGLLLAFLPDETLALIPLALGFLLMFGLMSAGGALGIFFKLMIILALAPFFSSLIATLPIWILVPLLLLYFYFILYTVLAAILGKGVRDHFIGSVLYGLVALPFRIIGIILTAIIRRPGI